MSIALPTSPAPTKIKPKLVRAGTDLTSPTNNIQRINRLGDKFSIEVTMPQMTREEGEVWVSRLLQSFGSTALLNYPQPYNGVGDPGIPRVNGAGQSGSSLILDGFTANYPVKEGRMFSLNTGGRRYMHMFTGSGNVNGSGQYTAGFTPMMRVSPADNALLEVAQPVIEGLVGGDEGSWSLESAQLIGLTFTLTEAR